ncbi:hypothetical protein [Brevibacterium aurantiacum]|uniref:hypothetical protein n=1 Tax=Brevibacterium aurantiacum TaxID=273384 RepID=UPI00196A6743|nr:hypothetical protein [Brevibacterium aurantiacum]
MASDTPAAFATSANVAAIRPPAPSLRAQVPRGQTYPECKHTRGEALDHRLLGTDAPARDNERPEELWFKAG